MSADPPNQNSYLADDEMVQIPKGYITDGLIFPVAIYVRLKAHTYILVVKKGDKALLEEHRSFQHENFQIYVRADERFLMTAFMEDLTRRTIDNPKISLGKRAQFVKGLLQDSYLELNATKFTNFERLKVVGQLIIKLAKQTEGFEQIFHVMSQQAPSDAKHSMMTALVSLILAEEANLLSPLNQDKLVQGALLHDIGLQSIAKEIREKPRHLWSAEELATYQQHPIAGAELLRYIDGMSVEVLLIISEHHELSNGTGYPKKLRDVRLNAMSRIVGLSDQFCDLISNTEGQTYSPEDALVYIENVLGQPYNKGLFSSLKNLVNVKNLTDKIKTSGHKVG